MPLDGPEQPPADMDNLDYLLSPASGAPTLAARDPQVSLALQALSSHTGAVAAGARAVTAR